MCVFRNSKNATLQKEPVLWNSPGSSSSAPSKMEQPASSAHSIQIITYLWPKPGTDTPPPRPKPLKKKIFIDQTFFYQDPYGHKVYLVNRINIHTKMYYYRENISYKGKLNSSAK